jgi:hypothetical protein
VETGTRPDACTGNDLSNVPVDKIIDILIIEFGIIPIVTVSLHNIAKGLIISAWDGKVSG